MTSQTWKAKMNLVFIIKNRDETPFMVVRTTSDGSTFEPMSDSAKDLAKILRQEYGKTPITKPELVQTMDASKIIEGPSPSGTVTQKKIANISLAKKELQTLPVLSISEVLLSEFSNEEFKNVLTFKASSFISDQTRASAHFEIKGVRAIWDPSLSIPGTNRRGGFRCPIGTRYGGQITDRFGRSCGWGVARRIANQIADIGERLEQRDDDKRKRRLDRRNARMIRRLGGNAREGRVEGGLRNIARRLEDGDAPKPRVGRNEVAETGDIDGGWRNVARGLIGQRRVPKRRVSEISPEAESPARVPRNRRRDVIPETAPTPAPAPRPRRPRPAPTGQRRPQPRPRVAPQTENVDVLTARDASDAGETEDFKPYVLRKYNEYAKRVREIRQGGGNAGMLTRREWYEINKDNLRDAWKGAHGRTAPLDFEPPTPQARRPRNNRRRRRQATAQGTGRTTSRKPTPNDVPEPAPARPVRPARPARPPRPARPAPANQQSDSEETTDRVIPLAFAFGLDDITYVERFDDIDPNVPAQGVNRRGQIRWNPDIVKAFDKAEEKIREQNLQNTHMPVYMANAVFVVRKADAKAVEEAFLSRGEGNLFGYRDVNANAFPNTNIGETPKTPKTPKTPPTPPQAPAPPRRPRGRRARQNAQQLKMNNLVDNHSTSMPKLQPQDGKFVSVPVGNKGINTVDEAKAYKGSLADIPDDFILDALEARTANSADRRGLTPEIRDAVLKVFPNLSDIQIKAKLEKLTIDIRKGINTNVRTGRGALPPQRIQENIALVKALKENGIDFVKMPVGSGITSPQFFLLLDENPEKWGRGYFLKFPDEDGDRFYNNGNAGSQHAEIIGNILAKNLGFANGSPRIAGGDDTGPFLLMDIFLNNADGKLVGGYNPNKIRDSESRLLNGVLNAVINVYDRHAGNGDLFAGNGAVPLDFGRARFKRQTAAELVNYFSSLFGMDPRPWQGYKRRLIGLQGQDKIKETQAIKKELQETIAKARKAIADSLDQIDQVDNAYDAIEDRVKTERRENIKYNLAQLGEPRFIDGLMDLILR